MLGWLVGWYSLESKLVGWLVVVDWLVDCGWLVGWYSLGSNMVCWLVGWLVLSRVQHDLLVGCLLA